MNQYVVFYRLDDGCLLGDRMLLQHVYEELAARRPAWLSCESFAHDDDECVCLFLLDGDLAASRAELPHLATYWESLPRRCHGDPRVAAMTRADVAQMPVRRIAFWDPGHGTWLLPGSRTDPVAAPRAATMMEG